MRSFMTQDATETVRLENFPGLCTHAPATEKAAAAELCNLRRMRDGSLSRRAGLVPVATLPQTLRGATCCERDGSEVIYAVAGAQVYAIVEAADGTRSQALIGQLQSTQGEVSFFTLDGELMMMDGLTMYALSPTEAAIIEPYLPLYGKDWTTDGEKAIYQERNMLTDRVRIRYVATAQTNVLRLHAEVVSVDAVFRDGVRWDPSTYTRNIYSNSLEFEDFLYIGEVTEVIVTLPTDTDALQMREDFFHCRCAVRPGEASKSVALLGGGNETGVLYLTEAIDAADREEAHAIEPRCRMLYLQKDGRIEMGNGQQEVRAMVRHYDRTLVMTDHGTWSTDMKRLQQRQTEQPLLAVNSTMGCTTFGGALTVGNHPISLWGRDILQWNADTDTLDECNAESIGGPIRELLEQETYAAGQLYYDRGRDEVWMVSSAGSSRVLIYQREMESFTVFDFGEMMVRGVFGREGRVGLLGGQTVYWLEDAAPCDQYPDGALRPIRCLYTSHGLPFGHTGQLLRPYEVWLCVDADAAQAIEITLTTADGRRLVTQALATGEQPCELIRRVAPGRCRHATLTVGCDCVGAFTLHAAAVAAGI